MTTDQLFQSAHAALLFAYNFQGAPALSVMNRMAQEPSSVPGKGLAGLDGAAQAGMIRRKVASLGNLHEALIIAEFAPRSRPCPCRSPCCSGHLRNQEWVDAIGYIADVVRTEALDGHRTTHPIRRACVERFFGLNIGVTKIADTLGIDRNALASMIGKSRKYLRDEQDKAQSAVHGELHDLIIKI